MTLKTNCLALALLLVTTSAQATIIQQGPPGTTLQVSVSDGTTTIVAADNDAADGDAGLFGFSIDGWINVAAVFDSFDLSLTTATSRPVLGSEHQPALHLDSVRVTNSRNNFSGPSVLTIMLTDTGFTGPLGPNVAFGSGIGGVTDGIVTLATYADSTNAAFGMETQLFSTDSLSGAFAASGNGHSITSDLYSLTMVATITHFAIGQDSSFDAFVQVPEPATLALMSAGFLGMFMGRRRRR